MQRTIAQCPICGKTITPEEVEIGISLVCPRCDPDRNRGERERAQVSAHPDTGDEEHS